ncbi:ATP-grasp domain-containing protein [Xylanibacillus composti]|uniref:Phosphoribosylglycinamide formyltransferase 2 n=1 Tax=Xylanibacillus composti TaxID=1572762 RepID=A0A8J4M2V2_9BACL|nr:ATP-grasp domain-containing protein [Xylanibacillus composti]MDT9726746.1 ATP-grasp domain-containing protein [Xylanibacillus composti]GIQ69322.1 phosphoribosylglycinamide formyltransferase 2 [Xylanibacillus composti]
MTKWREAWMEALHIDSQRGRLAWLGNFEVEQDWRSKDVIGLPGVPSVTQAPLALSELALLLAAPEDLVLLPSEPDDSFLSYLLSLGWRSPAIFAPESKSLSSNESLTCQLLAATSSGAPSAVRRWAEAGDGFLLPHGVSVWEEALAEDWHIPLAAPRTSVTREVNSKLFSRELCEQLGIPQVPGRTVRTLSELESAFAELAPHLAEGPLVLKEGMGVSGKGMLRIDSAAKFQQVLRMLRQSAVRQGTEHTEFVLEQWIDNAQDLNVQFLVSRDGQVRQVTILTALVQNGTHLGHMSPHQLTASAEERVRAYAEQIGQALHAHGYYGLVGLDAMIGRDGKLYPCIEINARLNMSTYHTRLLQDWAPAGKHALIRPFSFSKQAPLAFVQIQQALQAKLYRVDSGHGVILCAYAPVNSSDPHGRRGKLYTTMIGDSAEECLQLERFCRQQLQQIGGIGLKVDV